MYKFSKNKAFTLIELLVVIAIIGILAAVVIASLNSARSKARDARRISDIKNIQTALEMYYADYGMYPSSNTNCVSYNTIPNLSWCNSAQKNANGRWIANGLLAPYLSEDPVDPQQKTSIVATDFSANNISGGVYFYYSPSGGGNGCGAGQYYIIVAGMENSSNRKNEFKYCNGNSYNSGGSYFVGNSVSN